MKKRYVTLSTYASLCGVGLPAISIRLRKSFEGVYSENHPSYIELTEVDGVDGAFIDTEKYPPKRLNIKRKI